MSASSKKVLIRCDAAPEIGFGHVVRCLALADELRDSHGCHVDFAMLRGAQGVAQVQAQGYAVYQPAEGGEQLDEGHWLQELIAKCQHQVLILDVRTDLASAAVNSIRASGVLIVTIDDASERRLLADLAFYPPVPQVERLDWTGFTGQRFVGWDWVLLRPQFAEVAQRARERKSELQDDPPSTDGRRTLLVTMGGSDPAGLTLMAVEAIEKIDGDFRVLVVIGGGFVHDAALAEWLAKAKRSYEICRNVADMAALMAEVDLAVTSFGVTAYELAAIGVPAVYLCLTEDHAESARALERAGYGISLGFNNPNSAIKIIEIIGSLAAKKVEDFNGAAREKIDGLGAKRIVQSIEDKFLAR